jgi:pimeloyl-ACP methyl ester carboxylesterase
MRLFPYVLPKPLVRMSLAPAYGDPTRVTDDLVTRYRDLMLAPGARAAMLARLEQSTPQDPEPLLRRVRAPTLLVWGEKDAMIPFANAADYLKIVEGSRLVSFAALGHVPQEEDPAASLAPVLAFLAE